MGRKISTETVQRKYERLRCDKIWNRRIAKKHQSMRETWREKERKKNNQTYVYTNTYR